MACCFFAAFCISKLIRASELMHIDISVQYNDTLQDSSGVQNTAPGSTECVSTRLIISGMTCVACVETVEKALSDLNGVRKVGVSLPLERATVVHNPTKAPISKLVEGVENAGYGAKAGEWYTERTTASLRHAVDSSSLRSSFTGSMMLSALLFIMELAHSARWSSTPRPRALPWVHQILSLTIATAVQTYYVVWIHKRMLSHALRMRVTMDTLVSVSSILGIMLSIFNVVLQGPSKAETYFLTSSTIGMVVSGGKYLEVLLRRQSVSSLAALYKLKTKTSTVTLSNNQVGKPHIFNHIERDSDFTVMCSSGASETT